MSQSSIGGAGLMAWAIVWGMCHQDRNDNTFFNALEEVVDMP